MRSTDLEGAKNGAVDRAKASPRKWMAIAAVVVVGACSAFFGVRKKEHCPYTAAQPTDSYAVRICYEKSVPWLPLLFPEDYYVYADLYDQQGSRVERRLVANEDIPAYIEDRYSRTRWDPARRAFVDNRGNILIEAPAR